MKMTLVKFADDSGCAHCDSRIRRGSMAYSSDEGDACSRRCADALAEADDDLKNAARALEREAPARRAAFSPASRDTITAADGSRILITTRIVNGDLQISVFRETDKVGEPSLRGEYRAASPASMKKGGR